MKTQERIPLTGNPKEAWKPYRPSKKNPWDLQKAAHLFRRAGFGTSWSELQESLKQGPEKTIEQRCEPPAGETDLFLKTYDSYEKKSIGNDATNVGNAWWLHRIMNTPFPLLEKTTLFWHTITAVSNFHVNNAQLVSQHLQSLRRNALGDMRSAFVAMYHQPAVLIQLNAEKNRKVRPNHLLAEAVLKQARITRYSRDDVRGIARSFTGNFVLGGRLRFIPREHDTGTKVIFGQKGPWKADDAVRIVAQQPEAAESFVRKAASFFISDTQEFTEEMLSPLVEGFSKDFSVGALVKRLLSSKLFFSPASLRSKVKSPVDFAVELLKSLEGKASQQKLGKACAELGQDLYMPPAESGWKGGESWINAATLTGRSNLVFSLLYEPKQLESTVAPLALSNRYGFTGQAEAIRFFADLMFQGFEKSQVEQVKKQHTDDNGSPAETLKGFLHDLIRLPAYQLS